MVQEQEKQFYRYIKENFDANSIKCKNVKMKHEIDLDYEYKMKIENIHCIERNDHSDVDVLNCGELTIKTEIEDSSENNGYVSLHLIYVLLYLLPLYYS